MNEKPNRYDSPKKYQLNLNVISQSNNFYFIPICNNQEDIHFYSTRKNLFLANELILCSRLFRA